MAIPRRVDPLTCQEEPMPKPKIYGGTKATVELRPQEFLRFEKDRFVFLVKQPGKQDIVEACADKVRTVAGTRYNLQGVYLTADHQLISLFSHGFEGPDTEGLTGLVAVKSVVKQPGGKGQQHPIEPIWPSVAEFSFYGRGKDMVLTHRLVDETIEGKGIGSETLNRVERHAAALGYGRLVVPYVGLGDESRQRRQLEFLLRRGYEATTNPQGGKDLVKNLNEGDNECNLMSHHRIPIARENDGGYHAERIG